MNQALRGTSDTRTKHLSANAYTVYVSIIFAYASIVKLVVVYVYADDVNKSFVCSYFTDRWLLEIKLINFTRTALPSLVALQIY